VLVRRKDHPPSGMHVSHVKQPAWIFGVNGSYVTIHAESSLLGIIEYLQRARWLTHNAAIWMDIQLYAVDGLRFGHGKEMSCRGSQGYLWKN
jgi:hypothetical protein